LKFYKFSSELHHIMYQFIVIW